MDSGSFIKSKGSFVSEGENINYLLYHPREGPAFPAVIFHPGNRIFPQDYEWLHTKLVAKGYLVMALGQRGYGSGTPGVNDRAGEIQQRDLLQGLRHILSLDQVQTHRVGAIGHSNGGGLALRLAAFNEEVKCVVAMSMISDWGAFVGRARDYLPDYYEHVTKEFGGDPQENPGPYEVRSSLHLARRIKIPVQIVVGGDDTTTPAYLSRWMAEKLQEEGNKEVRLDVIPEVGHFYERYAFDGYKTEEVGNIIANWVAGTL